MSDIKTPADVAAELTKALGEKIDTLKKMELPQSPEKADGGQESSGSIPAMPKQAGGTTDAEMAKDEVVSVKRAECPGCGKKSAQEHEGVSGRKMVAICGNCKKRNVGNVKKMDLPASPEAATGGEIAKKSELDALDFAQALSKAVVEKIAGVREQLEKMERLEAAGNEDLAKGLKSKGVKKNIGSLPSNTPSNKQIADGDPNKSHPMPKSVFDIMNKGEGKFLPWAKGTKKPKVGKEVEAEGSGGSDTTKPGPSLQKDALPVAKPPKMPALKPAGVPGAKAGDAPKAPKAPGAPGQTGSTMKMELPQSPEKAGGGDMASGSVPAMPKQAGGTTDAEMEKEEMSPEETNIAEESSAEETHMGKDELPQTPEKAIGGQESSGSIPAMPKQAGGATDAEMKKNALPPNHASPVFAVHASVFGNKAAPGDPHGGKSGYLITQALPKLKPAAAGMHTVGQDGPPTPAPGDMGAGNKTVNLRSPVGKSEDMAKGVFSQAAQHSDPSFASHAASKAAAAPAAKPAPMGGPNDARAAAFSAALAGEFQPKAPIKTGLELAHPKAANLPKFGKAELDSVKCPGCKQGMTLCKCGSK